VEEALSRELLGAYLIGSLAHAGFSRRYSHIDIALVTEAGYPHRRC
jgi:predicted nucleotidyltransferase